MRTMHKLVKLWWQLVKLNLYKMKIEADDPLYAEYSETLNSFLRKLHRMNFNE